MQTALKQTVTIQEGGRIELCSPELPVGATAEVIILFEQPAALIVDESDEWSEEDLQDITRISWEHADVSLGEEPDA